MFNAPQFLSEAFVDYFVNIYSKARCICSDQRGLRFTSSKNRNTKPALTEIKQFDKKIESKI